MKVICITVSVNYDDILNVIIDQNIQFIDEWHVITSASDENTIKLIESRDYSNIKTLLYDFTANGHIFNKGGAIRSVQEKIYREQITAWREPILILILDSDIYLPDNFNNYINGNTFQKNILYTSDNRIDYHTIQCFNENTPSLNYTETYRDNPDHINVQCLGFFQLYYLDKTKLYQHSNNCEKCDLQFADLFPTKICLHGLNVSHIGEAAKNWNGRNVHEHIKSREAKKS